LGAVKEEDWSRDWRKALDLLIGEKFGVSLLLGSGRTTIEGNPGWIWCFLLIWENRGEHREGEIVVVL